MTLAFIFVVGSALVLAVLVGQSLSSVRFGIKHYARRLPASTLEDGVLRATFDVERPVELTLTRRSGGALLRLAAPMPPLRARPHFTASDATDEDAPFHASLNPLFGGVWDVDFIAVVDGDLVLETNLEHFSGSHAEEAVIQKQAGSLVRLASALEAELALEGAAGLRCPDCEVPLDEERGELHEAVCPDCGGRFLPRAAVERLVGAELGKSASELKEAAAGTRAVERCPSCDHKMSPVPVEDVIIGLCTGCGGAWLDEGELRAISGGRYAEL
jgi:Zn-finger nucleic acid-binding protein